MLLAELKKIEMRKKERERKQHDLQKLISAAEQNAESRKGSVKKTSGSSATKKMKAATPGQTKASKNIDTLKPLKYRHLWATKACPCYREVSSLRGQCVYMTSGRG